MLRKRHSGERLSGLDLLIVYAVPSKSHVLESVLMMVAFSLGSADHR